LRDEAEIRDPEKRAKLKQLLEAHDFTSEKALRNSAQALEKIGVIPAHVIAITNAIIDRLAQRN
jgi:hypothetical protein